MNERRYDLDWLRVIAFSLLILFHTGMMFNTWSWHIKNNETSEALNHVMRFLHQWRMPVLFLISGAAIWFILNRRTPSRFLVERLQRLFIPLVFGMLIIIPPQVYYERLFQHQYYASFGDFYRTVLQFTPYPEGNFSWHHLWYIPYILVYSLILLPLFLFLRRPRGQKLLTRIHGYLDNPGLMLWIAIPNWLGDALLRPFWPEDTHNLIADWANFTSTLLYFLWGFILVAGGPIWARIERQRKVTLLAGLLSYGLLVVLWEMKWPEQASMTALVFYRYLRNFCIWAWVLSLLGFAGRYLNLSNPFLTYATEAVYPFYQVHQTVTVILGYYLVAWPATIIVKFLVLAIGTFLGSWLIFLLIRENNLTRFLFGLKGRSKPITEGVPVTETAMIPR